MMLQKARMEGKAYEATMACYLERGKSDARFEGRL